MKFTFFILPFLFLFISCNSAQKRAPYDTENIIFQPKDKEILDEIFDILETEKNSSIPVLMIKAGTFFKETPYVASTLEINPEEEKLVVNLREMDCTTFAENCLAIARTMKKGAPTFEKFAYELQNIRYRDGKINGYPSRLHYFSDWIFNNDQKKLVKRVSKEIADIPYPLNVNFMSTHPGSYIQLKDSTLIPVIAKQEKEISSRTMFYIPKDKISEFEDKLMDGDIAGITTNINGMDIMHVVILVRKGGHICPMHASSSAGKVILSDETLEEYLLNSKRATGIMVARPLE
ncbi:MAG: DUF1460 domain-containing protein [Draconibacterium sp.]